MFKGFLKDNPTLQVIVTSNVNSGFKCILEGVGKTLWAYMALYGFAKHRQKHRQLILV